MVFEQILLRFVVLPRVIVYDRDVSRYASTNSNTISTSKASAEAFDVEIVLEFVLAYLLRLDPIPIII
jgi:hypothetical protein